MPLKHLKKPEIYRSKSYGRKRFLSYSKTFKEMVRNNKEVFSDALKLIRRIQRGEVKKAKSRKTGLEVEKLEFVHTNMYNKNLFRVKLNGYEFFVKESVENYTKPEIDVWKKADAYLKEIGRGFMGYKIKLVKPHMMIDDYLVSNFYPIDEYLNIEGMTNGKEKENISNVVSRLGKNMRKKGVEDVRPRNALYHPESKTIYLIDLISLYRYSKKRS